MGGTFMRCAGRSGTPGNPRCASIVPGTTQFTVILWGARSIANAFVMPASPAFAVITCAVGGPLWPVCPPIFTIVPPPA